MRSTLLFSVLWICLNGWAQVTSYTFDPGKINKELAVKMDSLYKEDQDSRLLVSTFKKEGRSQEALDSLSAVIRKKDSSNLVFVEQFIAQHGWLGPQEIGMQGVQALFLVIQHADLNTQNKYYPLIKQAEKDGKLLSSNVAILEDRIAVREGRPQQYGSQGYYDAEKKKTFIYPLKDLENLDQLRVSMGLNPMKEYMKSWDVEEYTSYLPYATELLEKSKQQHQPQ